MLDFLKWKKLPSIDGQFHFISREDVSVPTQEVESKPKPIEKVEAKGVVIQIEKVMGNHYGNSPKDFFHILVKVETLSDATDSDGYQVIKHDNSLPEVPLSKVGDKVTFSYWPNQVLSLASFSIDFSARKVDAE